MAVLTGAMGAAIGVVNGAAIGITSGTAIRTTSGVVVAGGRVKVVGAAC